MDILPVKLSFLRKESLSNRGFSRFFFHFTVSWNLPQSGKVGTKWFPEPWIGFKEEPVAKTSVFWFNCQTWKHWTFFPLNSPAKKTKRKQWHLGIPTSLQILLFFSLDSVVMQKMKRTLSTFVRLNPPCFRSGEFPHHVCKVFLKYPCPG